MRLTETPGSGRAARALPPRLALAVAAAALAFVLAGCGAGNPYPAGSYERGFHFNERGKHHEAVEALDAFIRTSPTDSLAPKAQYLKALSYMEIEEYPLAAVELRILRKDYPTSEYVEDAYFLEGVAYYRQVGRVERDLSPAHDARSHFRKFLELFPGSERVAETRDYLQRISDLIVRKRLGQAKVFGKLGRHEAAMLVLGTTLEQEGESTLLDRVLMQRAREALAAGQPDVAAEAYRKLLADHPGSDLAGAARKGLERLRIPDAS